MKYENGNKTDWIVSGTSNTSVKVKFEKLKCCPSSLKGNHGRCDPEAKCKKPGYQCSKSKLTNARAVAALHKLILESKVYKLAEDYYLVY